MTPPAAPPDLIFMRHRDEADAAISSFDSSPHETLTGGLEGLRGSRPSCPNGFQRRGGFRWATGPLLKEVSILPGKIPVLDHQQSLSSPPGRLAVIFIILAR